MPRMPRQVQIAHWLLLAAVIILIVEVLERRTGLISVGSLRRLRAPAQEEEQEQGATPAVEAQKKPRLSWFARRRAAKPPAPPVPLSPAPDAAPEAAPAQKPAEQKKPTDMFDAFKTARRRAKGRTKRKK